VTYRACAARDVTAVSARVAGHRRHCDTQSRGIFLEPIDLEVLTHTAVDSEQSYLQIGVACGDRIICVG